jgi:pyrroloquinoline-quinone synthase
MTEAELGRCLDSTVRQYALWQHPLYQAWMLGALTRDDLREYSMEYYHHVAAFPAYLREFARRLPAGELRHEVYQALCDVQGQNLHGRQAHAVAWSTFASELGADTAKLRDRKPLPKTQQLVDIFLELARSGSEAEALAAFYAYQSQAWRLAAHKAAALRNHYGINEDFLDYFVCCGESTVRHANVWRKQLFKIVDNDPSAITYALIAAELASKALWRALDGIRARREYLMD